MRVKCLIAGIALLSFYACSSEDYLDNEVMESNDELVTLSFSPYTMQSMTRAASAITDYASHLDVWIIEGTDVIEAHQTKGTTAGFGSVNVVLNKTKTYTLYAMAHNCTSDATLSDNIITFPDNKITRSFFYTTTFSPATTTTLSCEMDCISAQFKMTTTDAFPEEAGKMKFTVYQTPSAFNVLTKEGVTPIDKVTLYGNINVGPDRTASFTVTVLAADLTETSYVDIKAQCLEIGTGEGDVIEEKTFEDVPIKANWVSQYEGAFFTSEGMTLTFTANDWNYFDVTTF